MSHWTNPLFSDQIGAPHGYSLAWASTTSGSRGGYINASLTPADAIPPADTLLAHPDKKALRLFDDSIRSSGLGAIGVEHVWEEPWMNLGELGMPGTSVGGLTVYPMAALLASQTHAVAAAEAPVKRDRISLAPARRRSGRGLRDR